MSEVSTRIWLDERLWNEIMDKAMSEGITVRELIPRLVRRSIMGAPTSARQGGPAAEAVSAPSTGSASPQQGPPVMALSDVYRCGVCDAEIRLGGVSQHMNKHKKEREASEEERS